MKTISRIISIIIVCCSALSAQSSNKAVYNAESKSIIVPEGKPVQIKTDGTFSKGEWDDAVNYNIPGNCKIYMKTVAENLFIGIKSEKPFVCDLWITDNGNPIYQLHVSGALGQAEIISFPFKEDDQKRLVLNNNRNWEANYFTENKAKEAAWIAAGKPKGEKYWKIFDWAGALEYKINLKSFNLMKNSLRIKIDYYNFEEYRYPRNSSGENADNWLEIILPGQK